MADEISRLLDSANMNLLIAVSRHGGLSQAAKALGVSQPYISARVQALEEASGVKLFRRHRRGVELTGAGESVLLYGRAMLNLGANLRRQLAQAAGGLKVGIGMSEDFCRTALPGLLGVFQRDHADAEVRVVSGTYAVITEALARGEVDFAVMRQTELRPLAQPLWSSPLAWVGSPDLKLDPNAPVPLVVPLPPNPARDTPIETLNAAGVAWRIHFESSGLAGIEAAMQAGLGVCAAPANMRLHEVEVLRDAHLPELPPVTFVLDGHDAKPGPAAAAFAELLREGAQHGFARFEAAQPSQEAVIRDGVLYRLDNLETS